MVNIEDSKRTQSLTATGIRDSAGMCCLLLQLIHSAIMMNQLFDKFITSS